ncbi:hypothetical protein BHE74_00021017 [Ensete ventricosum]|nr:hypothetical protein BHE74_00021017 [Ensete ventricosum]
MGCGKADSRLQIKGVGVAGLLPRFVASLEGHLPWGCQAMSILATSDPPSSTKMLLGFSLCPRGQHNGIRPASAREAQRDVEFEEGVLGCSARVITLMRIFPSISWSCSCKERLSPRWWVPGEIPPMAKLALISIQLIAGFLNWDTAYFLQEAPGRRPLPTPDITILSLGTEIFYEKIPTFTSVLTLIECYNASLMQMQPPEKQRPLNVGFYLHKDHAEEVMKSLPKLLANHGVRKLETG